MSWKKPVTGFERTPPPWRASAALTGDVAVDRAAHELHQCHRAPRKAVSAGTVRNRLLRGARSGGDPVACRAGHGQIADNGRPLRAVGVDADRHGADVGQGIDQALEGVLVQGEIRAGGTRLTAPAVLGLDVKPPAGRAGDSAAGGVTITPLRFAVFV